MHPIRCHRATSEADRRLVLDIAHEANDVADPWSWYASARLSNPRRARAEWWLLTEGGAPRSSLLAYPLSLAHGEVMRSAVGIGSVATLPTQRGRGLGTQLVRHVLDEAETPDALLFSAIGPTPYDRIGFQVAPAYGWRHARPLVLVSDSNAAALRPIDPRRELDRLQEAAESFSPGLRLHRDPAAWLDSIADGPTDRWFAVEGGGTLRLGVDGQTLDVLELAVPSDRIDAVVQAVAGLAASVDLGITGWFAPTQWIEANLTATSRSKTQPMVRGDWDLTEVTLHPSDYF